MIDIGSVKIEVDTYKYIYGLWPEPVVKKLDPDGFDFLNLMKIAEAEGKDTSEMHLTVRALYELYGFEDANRKVKAVFFTNPLCWTDTPDWWWSTQRHSEPFKDLLRIATDTRQRVYVDLPEVELLPIPKWFSTKYHWSLVKK